MLLGLEKLGGTPFWTLKGSFLSDIHFWIPTLNMWPLRLLENHRDVQPSDHLHSRSMRGATKKYHHKRKCEVYAGTHFQKMRRKTFVFLLRNYRYFCRETGKQLQNWNFMRPQRAPKKRP